MLEQLLLDKSYAIYIKPDGEICNRLKQGTLVKIMKKKGNWFRINWRSGKKKGWIHRPTCINLDL